MKDKPITAVEAELIFHFILGLFERDVTRLVKSHVTATQFDALISFAYNVGTDIDADDIPEGLGDSTLLKRINANPNDLDIQNQFLKWNKSNGVASPGLTRRRKAEYHLYSTGELKLKF